MDTLTVMKINGKLLDVNTDEYISLVNTQRLIDLENDTVYICELLKMVGKLKVVKVLDNELLSFDSVKVKVNKINQTLAVLKYYNINHRYHQEVTTIYQINRDILSALRWENCGIKFSIHLKFSEDINLSDIYKTALAEHKLEYKKFLANTALMKHVKDRLKFHKYGIELFTQYLEQDYKLPIIKESKKIIPNNIIPVEIMNEMSVCC